MENDSNTDTTEKSTYSFSSLGETFRKNQGIIKNCRKTLNLVLIIIILYYVKTNNNVTMDNIPSLMGEIKDLVESAKNISSITGK